METEDYKYNTNLADYGELGRKIWDNLMKFENNGHHYTNKDRVERYHLIMKVCQSDEMSDQIKLFIIDSLTSEVENLELG